MRTFGSGRPRSLQARAPDGEDGNRTRAQAGSHADFLRRALRP